MSEGEDLAIPVEALEDMTPARHELEVGAARLASTA